MKDTTLMWYKVKELSGKMNKTQIGKSLGIHRDTGNCNMQIYIRHFSVRLNQQFYSQ